MKRMLLYLCAAACALVQIGASCVPAPPAPERRETGLIVSQEEERLAALAEELITVSPGELPKSVDLPGGCHRHETRDLKVPVSASPWDTPSRPTTRHVNVAGTSARSRTSSARLLSSIASTSDVRLEPLFETVWTC